jgi:DNA-binding response OmpR family regulator
MNELQARLRAQLRTFDNSEAAVFRIGQFTCRPSAKLLLGSAGKRRVQLTDKETAILKLLYRRGSKSVTRSVPLGKGWDYSSEVETRTLETHIYRLRRKLKANPAGGPLLICQASGCRLNAVISSQPLKVFQQNDITP